MEYQYVIIGGGIAGVTAAENIRQKDPTNRIAIISEESEILYSRVLLPSYLKKRITREQLFLRRPADFTDKGIDVLMNERVVGIDAKHRDVLLENGHTVGYQKLLLSTGGRVKQWDVTKSEPWLYRLQTIEDADRMRQALDQNRIINPVIAGSSFITLEFLEIFTSWGITPNLVVRDKHFFSRFVEEQGGQLFGNNFERHGIRAMYSDVIAQVLPGDSPSGDTPNTDKRPGAEPVPPLKALTRGLAQIPCDAVCLGIGIERPMEYLAGSGIERGEKGIRTNQYLETNDPRVFAAGDAAEFFDVIAGEYRVGGNWTNAVLQGKIAGLNMAGEHNEFRRVTSYSITNLGFQITVLGSQDAKECIMRVEWGKNQYERLFLKNGAVVGAALINRFQDKTHITKLIENRILLDAWREALADIRFDIHQIPVVM